MGEILVGTCSWAEKSLIKSGEFYPKHISSAEERLRYYSGVFNTVEVDSTFYAIPALRTVHLWSARTPEDFIFHIKAYAALTGHGVNPKTLPPDLRGAIKKDQQEKPLIYIKDRALIEELFNRFKDSLRPLINSGKLGLLVFQYPPWLHYSQRALEKILKTKSLLDGLELAVEFRHGSWLKAQNRHSVLRFLHENKITYIIADEPQFGTLDTVPYLPEVTTEFAYFRFHGRNTSTWLKRGIETSLRYDYLYSAEELMEFVPDIKRLSLKTRKTYAMFNNCHGASAVKNALMLMKLLQESTIS